MVHGFATMFYIQQWNKLHLMEGVLYRRWESSNGLLVAEQLVVPSGLRRAIFQLAHEQGHFGIDRTAEQLQRKKRAYLVGWRGDVRVELDRCANCAQYYRGKPHANLDSQVSGTPWSKVSIYITGTHPRSRTGCEYILTVMDHFTKLAEEFPIRNHKVHTVAKVLLDRLFSRFGMPEELLSDQGPEFGNDLVAECCKALGVRKSRTSLFRPTTNDMLE